MIVLTCQQCFVKHKIDRTSEIPKDALSMKCNWCPNCEHLADGNYEETFVYPKHKKEKKEEVLIDLNQMNIFDLGA